MMSKMKSISQAKAYKEALKLLTEDELAQFEAIINREIAVQVDRKTNNLNNSLLLSENMLDEYKRYKGFYDAVILHKVTEMGSTMYLNGIEEGIEYLAKKPDKIVQHLGDPNPKEKVIQHRKDRY
jgi:hypothetical protein